MRELSSHTVNSCIEAVWHAVPDKEAMVFYDDDSQRHSWTNQEVGILSERLASFMFMQGVKPGDVVCNMMTDSVEREIVNFGILLAGAVVMPLREEDILTQRLADDLVQEKTGIENDGTVLEVMHRGNVKFIAVTMDASSGWELVKHDVGLSDSNVEIMTRSEKILPTVKKVFKFNLEHHVREKKICERAQGKKCTKSCFDVILEHQGTMNKQVSESTAACILVDHDPIENHYRLVRRTHGEVIHECVKQMEMLDWTSDDIFYHNHQLLSTPGLMFHYILKGCTSVLPSPANCSFWMNVPYTWSLLESEHVTMAGFSAPELQMLKSYCEDLQEPHFTLRLVTTDGADVLRVGPPLMDAIGPVTRGIAVTYSRTEAGLVARHLVDCGNRSAYGRGCVGHVTRRDGWSVYMGFPHPDFLHQVNLGNSVGEILLSGHLMSRQYLGDPMLTRASYTNDGRLRTKDVGCFDEYNQLYILGRESDIILRGSTCMLIWEIEENFISECPGIRRVKMMPVRDERGYKLICACVIPRKYDEETLKPLREFCKEHLDSGELPVDFVLLLGASSAHHDRRIEYYLFSILAQRAVNGHLKEGCGDELITASKSSVRSSYVNTKLADEGSVFSLKEYNSIRSINE